MTEVDTVMHESPTPAPGCSPRREIDDNNAVVDSSLNESETDRNGVSVASNNETNKQNNTNTTFKSQSAVEKSTAPPTVFDNKCDANVGDVSTTTIDPEEDEEDSQVTSSSADVVGSQDKKNNSDVSTPTPQSTAFIDENSTNSHQERDDENIEDLASKTETNPSVDGTQEGSQNCNSVINDNGQRLGDNDKQKLQIVNNDNSTERSSPEDDGEDLKSTEDDVSPSFEGSKLAISSPVIVNQQSADEPMEVDGTADNDGDNEADPLGGACNDTTISTMEYAKNGADSNTKNESSTSGTDNNGAVVELDDSEDDDDDDNDDVGEVKDNTNQSQKQQSNCNNSKSICTDSDDAVVIGSDSESESNTKSPPTTTTAAEAGGVKKSNVPPMAASSTSTSTHVIDDDDDDCVVVEDESSPMELTSAEQTKRKNTAVDAELTSDDSQPPSKRQRSGVLSSTSNTAASQLEIKDARSLTPSDLSSNARKSMSNDTVTASAIVYPVNITTAGSSANPGVGPPKLAPLGGGNGSVNAINVMPGIPNLTTNANLLPGLTDDMFVLEAPSFIVPYIYEKPPGENLKGIVKGIETKYELTKEDLTEGDKSDEFDMMTEQNKVDRDPVAEQAGKKKKKKRGGEDVDDSWSEESDEDDDDEDDDDSDAGVRTKVLIKEASDDLAALKGAIKPAAVVVQSTAGGPTAGVVTSKPGQENYFESPLGKFFMDIGVGLVQEFVQSDLIRLQRRKMRKTLGQNTGDFERAITALSGNLEASKKKNAPYKFTMKRCEFCNFKSESALAMANHYETPHMNGPLYKCNFCTFEIRNATEIVYHMEAMHNIKARLIKPLPYHQCPNCGFEDNGKAKLARHQPVCAKKFRPDLNLAPPNDWEAPAKIPRIKPRHGLVGTATAYQAMAAQAAAQKAALATIQQQQQQAQARNIQAAALAAQNAVKIRGRSPAMTKTTGNANGTATLLRGQSNVGPRSMATNVVLPNNYQIPGNQLLQANALAGKKTSLPGQPSISITPLPRQGTSPQTTAPSTSKMPPAGMKPGKNLATAGNNKAQFVICEICDGYIKDLEQLRNHMQWMHEVKIHPKMIYNRPPLNCQKCQFRFFTDQGLERHLLGSHGLVTSSMQEAANNGKDAGRCPVCGRMYQWKLLNHVARDHHMTLKPAHLSYKCTVCTATFGMYKQFETHVYTAHSTVAKKAMDGKKNNAPTTSASAAAATSSGSQRAAANDALLKPLKINDEITIIPQPASKPRITNMESHVID